MEFKRITRSDINEQKWNHRIENSDYPHAYGTTWFLDVVCPSGWEALIWGDYDAVMPLPIGEILFYKQTFTPFWIQQLGIFKRPGLEVDAEALNIYINNTYRLFDICVFDPTDFKKEWVMNERVNYELELGEYPKSAYSKNLKRLIKKAEKRELKWSKTTDSDRLIQFFRNNKGKEIDDYRDQDYDRLHQLIQQELDADRGIILQVKDQEEVIAMAFFHISFGRATYLLGTSNAKGRSCGAMQFAMDVFISNWSSQLEKLDFEGSVIPGIQRFFKSFGASPIKYYRVKLNRLPFPLNLLKK